MQVIGSGKGRIAARLVGVVLATLTCGCDKDDIGKLCGNDDPGEFPPEPIGGEQPSVEVVRVQRDSRCETFQCITHGGLRPYCTRTCEMKPPSSSPTPCGPNEKDCPGDTYCYRENALAAGGVCRDDDCPPGFWCRQPQQVGPLAGKTFCVRKERCDRNLDCEDPGRMECRKNLVCVSECELRDSCTFDRMICEQVDMVAWGCKEPEDPAQEVTCSEDDDWGQTGCCLDSPARADLHLDCVPPMDERRCIKKKNVCVQKRIATP